MMRRRRIAGAAALCALVAVAAACNGDDESSTSKAQAAMCDDANSLSSAVSDLVDDVKNGNFGDAQDQLSTVQSSFGSLERSAKELASTKRSTVQDQLDGVKGTLSDLTSASSLADIGQTLDKAASQLEDVASTISDILSC
jgi:hypothetical protein